MKNIYILLLHLFCVPIAALADTYPEVVFDNSLVKGSYAKSIVSYEGNSWVENVNNHLLVSDTLFFTPGNALSLKYISEDEGDWKTEIRYSRQKFHYRFKDSDFLSFRIYVKTYETATYDLPKVYIAKRGGGSDTLDIADYLVDFERGKWIQVRIPCKEFNLGKNEEIINGVGFSQHGSSSKTHHIFIDQIEFLPHRYSEVRLTTAAILTEAVAKDRMVHLKWQLPLTPSIRYIKIYRSEDGKNYKAVGIKPIHMQSCLDIVPRIGAKYYYKITWVDYNYRESLFSASREVQTSVLADEAIIDVIQQAHINYFVENFDINSGMYLPYRSKDKAVVSTKETSGAILSLIIGTEKGYVNRYTSLNRVSKIVFFLLKAQHMHGIFPAYFDGRSGTPDYRRGVASYDVAATSAIIEALLIAREYFNKDTEEEKDLRSRITFLYQQINWQNITHEGSGEALIIKRFGLMDKDNSEQVVETLSGPNEAISSYLLAISSDKYALDSSLFHKAIYYNYNLAQDEVIEELDADIYTDSLFTELDSVQQDFEQVSTDSVVRTSIINPIRKYGVALPIGEYNTSLMDLFKPFSTIRPTLIQDTVINWSDVLNNYTKYIKRRDNELGVGTSSSDIWGFYQHRDSIGNYRINPAIAPSSIIANAELGKASILALYHNYGHILFTEYGFRAWLDLRNDDVSDEYLAANQASMVIMLENYKTGLIWKLYEQIPELKRTREKLFVHKSR